MVELTIDGHTVSVPPGSMVMHAVEKLGEYVPHFCYHKKLSIAANCRMCLVDVEKAPKPLPACATPVSQGMIVRTQSELAKKAQQGVMEMLLINHPLDCPICDQGGECQLQDLAVGYGASESQYTEEKRVVEHKTAGPLISMEEMSRCIHCTRCVRFGQEVAGVMELGMLNRGEHAEITSFLGNTIDSEVSGNMIDICPVGALTSKPFRYQARTWELQRRKGVAAHDSLGSNLTVQVKAGEVLRVVPLENEAVNECWISDRDRFSYEGLNSADRLTQPMIKTDGVWNAVTWADALAASEKVLQNTRKNAAIQAHPMASLEEQTLLAQLAQSVNASADLGQGYATRTGLTGLGMPVADIANLDRVLLIGSTLRSEQPLLATRLRHATKRGMQLSVLHSANDDLLMPTKARMIVKPSAIVSSLIEIVAAVATQKQIPAPALIQNVMPSPAAKEIAMSLCSGEKIAIFLGEVAQNAADAAAISALAQWIAQQTSGVCGVFPQGANAVGAAWVASSLNLTTHAGTSLNASVLLSLHIEPNLDSGSVGKAGQNHIALTAYRTAALDASASILLPVATFSETSGTYVNMAGDVQSFNPSVKPKGEARPAWKVLRTLAANMGGTSSVISAEIPETLKAAVLSVLSADKLNVNKVDSNTVISIEKITNTPAAANQLEVLAEQGMYAGDAIVRRSHALQSTMQSARDNTARMNGATLANFAMNVKISNAGGSCILPVGLDNTLPDGVIRLAYGVAGTAGLNVRAANLVTVEAA